MTVKNKASHGITLIGVIAFGAIVNWVAYQFQKDFAGPITATSVFLLCTLILYKKSETWKDYGLYKPKKLLRLLWQVPVVLVSTILVGALANKLFSSFLEVQVMTQSRFEGLSENLPLFLMWVVIGWVVGGFFEEMIFRGFMLGHIEKLLGNHKWSAIIGVIGQAFLFGMVHFYNRGIVGGLTIFAVGLMLGLLFLKFGRNLWPLILAHGIIDTLSFLEDFLAAS